MNKCTDRCTRCGSYAINHNLHGRDGSDADLCDVCYWRKRAEEALELDKDAARLKLNALLSYMSDDRKKQRRV